MDGSGTPGNSCAAAHLLLLLLQAVRHGRDTQQAGRCGRSHALIRLTVRSGSNSASPAALPGTSPGPSTLACLTFADLAGSEGLAEGRHIDQSLLALGKVIRGLAANNSGECTHCCCCCVRQSSRRVQLAVQCPTL
jgi:hypothetical protein